MASFGLVVQNEREAIKFFIDSKNRLEDANLLKNPFRGTVKINFKNGFGEAFFYMKPIYPNLAIWILGFWILMGGAAWFILHLMIPWWIHLILAILIVANVAVHSDFYPAFAARAGLRKAGYRGKVRVLMGGDLYGLLIERLP